MSGVYVRLACKSLDMGWQSWIRSPNRRTHSVELSNGQCLSPPNAKQINGGLPQCAYGDYIDMY